MRYAIASSPDIRLVEVRSAPSLAVTLATWQVEAAPSPRLVGAIEVQLTTTDRAVHSEIIRAEEPIAADLPGDLAAAAGQLLGHIANNWCSRVMHQGSGRHGLHQGSRRLRRDRGFSTAPSLASLGLGQERQRGAAPGCAASCPPSTLMVIVWPTAN